MSSGSKPPPAPDYMALAKQQAGIQQGQVEQQTLANRPNVYNPYGSSTWSKDPTTGQWANQQQYNPTVQGIVNQQQQNQGRLAQTAGGLIGGIQQNLSQPMDFSGMTTPQAF